MQHGDSAKLVAQVCRYEEFYELILVVKPIRQWGRIYGWYSRRQDVAEEISRMPHDDLSIRNHAWVSVANLIARLGMYRIQLDELPIKITHTSYSVLATVVKSALLYALRHCLYADKELGLDLVTTIFPNSRHAFPKWLCSSDQFGWIGSYSKGEVGTELSKLFMMSGEIEKLLACRSWGPFITSAQFQSLLPLIREKSPAYGMRIRIYPDSPPTDIYKHMGLTQKMWVHYVSRWILNGSGSPHLISTALECMPEGRHKHRLRIMNYRRVRGTYMTKGEPTPGRYTRHPHRYLPPPPMPSQK